MKPKDQWDREDWLDYLDGWHERSVERRTTDRNLGRVVQFRDGDGRINSIVARELYDLGKQERAELGGTL